MSLLKIVKYFLKNYFETEPFTSLLLPVHPPLKKLLSSFKI